MIPLITHTDRLTLVATSRALLTAELHKPRYFPVLLGADVPLSWPPAPYGQAIMREVLDKLTAGGRDAAGWHTWYALRKATPDTPRTLVGLGSFGGAPDADGATALDFGIVGEWRGQGLGTELVAALVQQAAATGQVRRLRAAVPAGDEPALRALQANGFTEAAPEGAGDDARRCLERPVAPAADAPA